MEDPRQSEAAPASLLAQNTPIYDEINAEPMADGAESANDQANMTKQMMKGQDEPSDDRTDIALAENAHEMKLSAVGDELDLPKAAEHSDTDADADSALKSGSKQVERAKIDD